MVCRQQDEYVKRFGKGEAGEKKKKRGEMGFKSTQLIAAVFVHILD